MSASFQLTLVWSQISLFEAGLVDPYNDWTERHLTQGFTWRPGSVSFKVPALHGKVHVTVELIDHVEVDDNSRWAMLVPFSTFAGNVEISTIEESQPLDLPSGRFAVLYQAGLNDDGEAWTRFGFQQLTGDYPVVPTILRGDDEVHADAHRLLMEAEPAYA